MAIVAIDDGPLNKRRKAGRPPRDPNDWTRAFLEYYARRGNQHTAARAAGVSVGTVTKHYRASEAFRRAYKLAYREYGALLAETLGQLGIEKGNVIALIASLKGHSTRYAKRYSEKLVDQRVINNTYNDNRTMVSESAARSLLSEMLSEMTPASHRMLSAPEIIDAVPSEARPAE